MKTTIYWTMQHSRRAAHELRFRATCWWLSQQVEFLEWRLRLGSTDATCAIQSCADVGRTRRSACRALDVMEHA